MGVPNYQAMADARSTGAGIKCLKCSLRIKATFSCEVMDMWLRLCDPPPPPPPHPPKKHKNWQWLWVAIGRIIVYFAQAARVLQ